MTTINNMVTVNNAQKLVKRIRIRCSKVGLMPSILGVRVADNARLLENIGAGISTILPEEFNKFCKVLKLNKGSEDFNIFVDLIKTSYSMYENPDALICELNDVLGIEKEERVPEIVTPTVITNVTEDNTVNDDEVEVDDVIRYRHELHHFIKKWCENNGETMMSLSMIISNSKTRNAFSSITSGQGNFHPKYIKNLFDIMGLEYSSGDGAKLFDIIKRAYRPRTEKSIPQVIDETVFTINFDKDTIKTVVADTPSVTIEEDTKTSADCIDEIFVNLGNKEPEEIPDEVKEARKAFGEKLGFYCFRKGITASRFSELIALEEKELKDILNGNTNTPSEFHMINIVKLLDLNASERKELMELDARGRVELSELPKYYEKYIRKSEIIETLGILAEADIDGFEVANALQSLVKEAKKKLAR